MRSNEERGATAIATERDVHVVTDKRRQTDVPAPPEFLEVTCGVREVERKKVGLRKARKRPQYSKR